MRFGVSCHFLRVTLYHMYVGTPSAHLYDNWGGPLLTDKLPFLGQWISFQILLGTAPHVHNDHFLCWGQKECISKLHPLCASGSSFWQLLVCQENVSQIQTPQANAETKPTSSAYPAQIWSHNSIRHGQRSNTASWTRVKESHTASKQQNIHIPGKGSIQQYSPHKAPSHPNNLHLWKECLSTQNNR